MGALPKPALPPGPAADLFDRLHELHHLAGWPSLRVMAREVGCSHTTVSAAFSEPKVPRWGMVELIVETLGGDPEEFHKLWLTASGPPVEPARVVPAAMPPEPAPMAMPPRQLPADVAGFTGRDEQLTTLDALIGTPGPALPLIIVSGTAGVGKTALALHWAHTVADRFPDGQLYLDLRGYGQESPIPAAEALEILLRSLGLSGAAVPHDVPERAARLRTLLADRRLLMLLDNAHSVDQVRDLLPGSPGCCVLVTSRGSLPALVARHGATRVDVDLLPAGDAVGLLRRLVGRRVDDAPEAAARLAERCARLPLALRVAAELAIGRPRATLDRLVAELDGDLGALDSLTAGDDEGTGVRAVFSWSVRNLSPTAADAFALAGLHPGQDFEERAVAALIDDSMVAARRALAELARAHLVVEQAPGRYAMHDLLKEYAAELGADRGREQIDAALSRLAVHYLGAAGAAMDTTYPSTRHQRPQLDLPASEFESAAAARDWLAAEWRNVIAVSYAMRSGAASPGLTQTAAVLASYLDEQAHYDEAQDLHQQARTAAIARGDRGAEAIAEHNLGIVSRRLGRFSDALARHDAAVIGFREVADEGGQARAHHGIGVLLWRRGYYRKAAERLSQAVELAEGCGDVVSEGAARYSLGIALRRLGRYVEAEAQHRRAVALLHEAGDVGGEAKARNNLGVLCTFLGRYDEALEHLDLAGRMQAETGDRVGVVVSMENTALVLCRVGRLEESLALHEDALERSLAIGSAVLEGDVRRGLGLVLAALDHADRARSELIRAAEIGHQIGEADIETAALIDLGDVLSSQGRIEEAEEAYGTATELATRCADRYEQARAAVGVGQLRAAAGDGPAARELWALARNIFSELGVPEADRVPQ